MVVAVEIRLAGEWLAPVEFGKESSFAAAPEAPSRLLQEPVVPGEALPPPAVVEPQAGHMAVHSLAAVVERLVDNRPQVRPHSGTQRLVAVEAEPSLRNTPAGLPGSRRKHPSDHNTSAGTLSGSHKRLGRLSCDIPAVTPFALIPAPGLSVEPLRIVAGLAVTLERPTVVAPPSPLRAALLLRARMPSAERPEP